VQKIQKPIRALILVLESSDGKIEERQEEEDSFEGV
jgi:hypothetical protein